MNSPYRSLDDVVDGLTALEGQFLARGDRRAIFASLYRVVSEEMHTRVARREFADAEWVGRYAVAFANLYREAIECFDARRLDRLPKAWRLSFETANAGNALVLQDVLLGVNAHVNSDLSAALAIVSIDPDRTQRYRDHSAVNAVLAAVTERATSRLALLYAPGFTVMDTCAGHVDEILSTFSLEVARDSSWEGAVSLANARNDFERRLVSRLIETRAAALARLLLAPSSNAAFMTACRRVEQGTTWMTLLAAGSLWSLHGADRP